MAMTLEQAMRDHLPEVTECPRSMCSTIGDFIAVYLTEEAFYTERIDPRLTIHRNLKTHELVGCTLKGISILAKNYLNMFDIDDEEVELRVLLFGASGDETEVNEYYYELGQKSIPISLSAFREAA